MENENRRELEARASALRIALSQTRDETLEYLEAAVGCMKAAMTAQQAKTYKQEFAGIRGMTAEKTDRVENNRKAWREELAELQPLLDAMPEDEDGGARADLD